MICKINIRYVLGPYLSHYIININREKWNDELQKYYKICNIIIKGFTLVVVNYNFFRNHQ